jgi:Reverse transcriptase (RNA-dependent DNA polymerase)
LCALDVSKAFDKMNHHGMFIKLMNRRVPVSLLSMLENWFSNCITYVKWSGSCSNSFSLTCGIRQGGVLSPYLFAVYIDDLIVDITKLSIGCVSHFVPVCIVVYADDIILLAPSVTALQRLVTVCDSILQSLDLAINIKKSVCTRIGPRCNAPCANIVTSDGKSLQWVDSIRYLGVFITRHRNFKCSLHHAKQSFYRSFNAIYGKIGRTASEEVTLSLIKSKCIPCLLYGLDACHINNADGHSLNFTVRRILFKIFHTSSLEIIRDCQIFFNFLDVTVSVQQRKHKFLNRYATSENYVCRAFRNVAQSELRTIVHTS